MATQQKASIFSPAIRRNWGYWDGINAKGRYPCWAKSHIHRQKHPSDKAYGEGFWAGWYGEAHPHYPNIYPSSPEFQRRS